MKKTAEFVSPMHPDKICDYIADSILDAYRVQDSESRVAVEVMGGHGLITINGEVSSTAVIDIEAIVQEIVGKEFRVIVNIARQSPEIARGVDTGGAGDQGIMKGYATHETPTYMPIEYEYARSLCQHIFSVYPYDGKTQVTVEDGIVTTVVVSFQNTKTNELLELVKEFIQAKEYLINPAGEWTQGGFDADTGLSGRKLVVDNYGPEIAIGGGSFSGKDYKRLTVPVRIWLEKSPLSTCRNIMRRGCIQNWPMRLGKVSPLWLSPLLTELDKKFKDTTCLHRESEIISNSKLFAMLIHVNGGILVGKGLIYNKL